MENAVKGGPRWRGNRGGSGGSRRGGGRGSSRGGGASSRSGQLDGSGVAGVQVDPAKAKTLLFTWLQRVRKASRPSEYVSLENSRGRKGHTCIAWVWIDEQWQEFEAGEGHVSKTDAVAAAYAAAVEGLGVPVPPDCALSDEKKSKINAEERRRAQAAEQRAKAVDEACRDIEAQLLKAFFPAAADSGDGFRTPRETEEETMPVPLPPRMPLPVPVESKGGEERGNKSLQQLKQLVKRESTLLQGPSMYEAQRGVPGGAMHVCAYALLFDGKVAVLGTAHGTKRNSVRSAAASSLMCRLDTSASLPSRDEAGQHASEVLELKRLQQLQTFKVWAFEGTRPSESLRWYAVLWGQVPFNGGLRDFWGRGAADEKMLAVGSACGAAAGALTKMLGSADCVTWLRKMARVTMEVGDVPVETRTAIEDAEDDGTIDDYEEKLQRWLAGRKSNIELIDPPDLDGGPAATEPQFYEPEPEDGPAEKAKDARGVPKLPVRELRGQVGDVLGDSCCVVISGGTGSGKSTQVPQYLVDDFRPGSAEGESGVVGDGLDEDLAAWRGPARVVVTEPRRIAAISLAERVAWERGEPVGRSVGYSVRGDSKAPKSRQGEGSIEFCTVGILLRRLQRDPRLRQVSHVIVDEVHERDLMTDFLLILLKELLCIRSDLRVLLMSATLDVKTFTTYLWNCPCLEIPTGPRYEVEEIHLEDAYFSERWAGDLPASLLAREQEARRLAEKREEEAAADEEPDADMDDSRTMSSMNTWWGCAENDEQYMDLMARLILNISDGPALLDDENLPGSVLCFLPGWAEIKAVQDRLQEFDRRNTKLWVLPLHSTLPKEEQQLIFQRPPPGKTKIVLTTNIAESSVTIDDVLVVLDAGLAREVAYDPVRHLSTLETVWVSQSSAIQRKGRAGRVRKGRCYRLYSRAQLEQAPWRSPPEMQRCELTSTCLQALALQREVRGFLARAPDPPTGMAVEMAMEELVQLGAICSAETSEQERGKGTPCEQMMPLGEALSRMTLSPKLGRMLIMGVVFGATNEACLLAAVIAAQRRIFACPPGKKKESMACSRGFSSTSDTLAAYEACKDYEGWKLARSELHADRWASDLFLVPKRVKGLLQARDSHWEELQRAGLLGRYTFEESMWETSRASRIGRSDDAAIESREAWDDDGGADVATTAGSTVAEEEDLLHAKGESEGGDPIELVKALLVAAYPQNVALRRRVGMAKHNTPTGLEAIVAPQSVNAPPKSKVSEGLSSGRQASWWSYGNLHISQKQGFLRTTTLVDPFHIALFGGLSTLVDTGERNLALREIDGWIELRGPRSTLWALAKLREAISRSVHMRTLEPGALLPGGTKSLLCEVVRLLRTCTSRQDALRASLPDAPTQFVERPPPPPPLSERRRSQQKAGGGKGRGKNPVRWGSGGERNSWAVDAWSNPGGGGKSNGDTGKNQKQADEESSSQGGKGRSWIALDWRQAAADGSDAWQGGAQSTPDVAGSWATIGDSRGDGWSVPWDATSTSYDSASWCTASWAQGSTWGGAAW